MRLEGQFKGGFYPTPQNLINAIASHISTVNSNGVVRALDPCCGSGDALEGLADYWMNRYRHRVITFGVELHADRADEAQENLDVAIASDLFQCSIANEAFDVLFLNPPYDHDTADKRVEHAFLVHCTRYLKAEGVLIYLVPRHTLIPSARYLSTMYGNLRCFWFPEEEREAYDQVVLYGKKLGDGIPDMKLHRQVVEWAEDGPEVLYPTQYPKYYATYGAPGDVQFYSRGIDPVRSSEEARKTGLWASREIQDALWPAQQELVRPLMPLRRGHMAMMVAAGFLNNLVLESEEERIMVRGKTTKEMILVEESEEKEVYREKLKTTVVVLNLDTGVITDVQA